MFSRKVRGILVAGCKATCTEKKEIFGTIRA